MIKHTDTLILPACDRPIVAALLHCGDAARLRRVVGAPLTAFVFRVTPPDQLTCESPVRTAASERRASVWLHHLAERAARAVARMREPYPMPAHAAETLAADTELSDYLGVLLAAHSGLVTRAVSLFDRECPDPDAALSAANAALWRSLMAFDPLAGVRFSTFAMVALRNAVGAVRVARGAKRRRATECADQESADHFVRTAASASAGPEAITLAAERREQIDALLNTLPPRSRSAVRSAFGVGVPLTSQSAIAMQLGISRERARQIVANALRKLSHRTPPR